MATSAERVKAIQRALSHPQFYDGDMGADIRWLLAENELLRDYERVGARDYKTLETTVLAFVKRCRDIRDGSPNAFYAHVDRFCKVFTGTVETPNNAYCICEIDRHDFNCPVHSAGEPPRE
jgi:hypothetical protein